MNTIKITKADLDKDNYYNENGIGFDGPELGLSFSYKLFAGTATWTNSATKTVTCGKLLKGTIAYGDLIETGMPEEVKQSDATTEAIALLKAKGYQIIKS